MDRVVIYLVILCLARTFFMDKSSITFFNINIGCQRGLSWCKDSTGEEGGNCCSNFDCSLEEVRRLTDPTNIAARRPVCYYQGGVQIGKVDYTRAAYETTSGG